MIEDLLSEKLANNPKLFRETVKKFLQAAVSNGKNGRSRMRGGSRNMLGMGPRMGRGRGAGNGFGDDDSDFDGDFEDGDSLINDMIGAGEGFRPDGFGGNGSGDPTQEKQHLWNTLAMGAVGGKGYSFGSASGSGSTREVAGQLATQLLHTDTPTNRTDDVTQLTQQLDEGMQRLKEMKKKYFEYTPVQHFAMMCAKLSDASAAQTSL